jgi:nicotinamide riboside kinase
MLGSTELITPRSGLNLLWRGCKFDVNRNVPVVTDTDDKHKDVATATMVAMVLLCRACEATRDEDGRNLEQEVQKKSFHREVDQALSAQEGRKPPRLSRGGCN